MIKKELLALNEELRGLATTACNDILIIPKKLKENPALIIGDGISTTATILFLEYGGLQATVSSIPDYFHKISWFVKGYGQACRSERNRLVRTNARTVDSLITDALGVTPNPNLDNSMKSLKELDQKREGYVKKVDEYCDRAYMS